MVVVPLWCRCCVAPAARRKQQAVPVISLGIDGINQCWLRSVRKAEGVMPVAATYSSAGIVSWRMPALWTTMAVHAGTRLFFLFRRQYFHSRVVGPCPVTTDCIVTMSNSDNNNIQQCYAVPLLVLVLVPLLYDTW